MEYLRDYKKIVGPKVITNIRRKAEKISDKHILTINSTYQGGGVAEILNSLVPLFNEVGVKTGWRNLHGTPDFFTVTKKFHNALQGGTINLSEKKKRIYMDTNERFAQFTHIDHDLVLINDPQPLPLINFYKKKQPWVFRCHIDIFNPNPLMWNYVEGFIRKYDHFVVSKNEYKKNLDILQSVIPPAIDPLSTKNKEINSRSVEKCLGKYGVEMHKPIVSQISRFDRWKDPLGVVKVFEQVRKKSNCQLVMLGSFATDDPEGQMIFEKLEKRTSKSRYKRDIKLISIENDFLVNCLQRGSAVVIQKSKREGFGLTVSEALYKGTPVVASRAGGIPLQVIDGVSGFLHDPNANEAFAKSVLKLMKDEKLRHEMGQNGKEYVKSNFLITRLMVDWLDLFEQYLTQTKLKLSYQKNLVRIESYFYPTVDFLFKKRYLGRKGFNRFSWK